MKVILNLEKDDLLAGATVARFVLEQTEQFGPPSDNLSFVGKGDQVFIVRHNANSITVNLAGPS